MLDQLRQQVPGEEFDYNILMSVLADYKSPHDKIRHLLSEGAIIRVKKGLYCFGTRYTRRPVSREVLANLIYGPSYLSCEYALAYYGLIPERSFLVTSMTNKRNKRFHTPVGDFAYYYLHPTKYAVGIAQVLLDDARHCLMATPEKALADQVARQRDLTTTSSLREYLLDDLRIDEERLNTLQPELLRDIAEHYRQPAVGLLVTVIKELL